MKFKKLNILTVIALLLTAFPVASLNSVSAASLSKVSDTLEDSRPGQDSNHTIQFVTPTGVDASTDTIILTFDSAGDLFDLTSIDHTDIDLGVDGDANCDGSWTQKTLAGSAASGTWGVAVDATAPGETITFTAPTNAITGEITAGRCVQILIGDNATSGTTGDQKINNSTAGVKNIDISGTFGDTGTAMVAIVATITSSVTINQTLTFTVTGQTAAQCVDYDDTAGNEFDSTSTTLPFGTIPTDFVADTDFRDGCLQLAVSTNGANGYSVSVKESDQLTSGSNTIADGACDGGCSETAEADWATVTNNGLGYCMQDNAGGGDGAATADAGWGTNGCDASNTFFKLLPELNVDSPEQATIMSSATGGVSDSADIGFRLSVDATQPAGTYTNNVILVATPMF